MASKKLRLGMIGTGVAARELYLPALQSLGRKIELVACANRTRRKAVSYAKLAGIPKVVDTADELLALPEVDAVLISLPIALQPDLVKKALAVGKPVLSEKPVGPTLVAGRRLVKACAKYDTPWLVGENVAFMSAVAKAKKWVEQGKLGEIRLVEARQMTWMDKKNPYFNTSWRLEPQHIGGFISDGGVHVACALRALAGTPKVLKNATAQFDPSLPPIDTAVALLQFPSGALGTWTSCFTAHDSNPMLRMLGSKGTLELGWDTVTFTNPKGKETLFKGKGNSFELQFSHFVDVVKNGAEVAYPASEALADLELIDAIAK